MLQGFFRRSPPAISWLTFAFTPLGSPNQSIPLYCFLRFPKCTTNLLPLPFLLFTKLLACHSSSFIFHLIFRVFLRHILINTCIRFFMFFVLLQVSHPQSMAAVVFISNRRNLVVKDNFLDLCIGSS